MTDDRTATLAAYRDAVDRAVTGSPHVAIGVTRLELFANEGEAE